MHLCFRNTVTMKSGCFAGERDEVIMNLSIYPNLISISSLVSMLYLDLMIFVFTGGNYLIKQMVHNYINSNMYSINSNMYSINSNVYSINSNM